MTKSGHFWITYLPRLVNVVCERPLRWERNYFHIDFWIRILLEFSFFQYPSFFFWIWLDSSYRQTGNYLRKYVFKKRIIGLNISLFYVYFFLPECVVPIGRSPCSPEFLKDLYQVQEETWKFFFLAHIQLFFSLFWSQTSAF